MKLQVIIRRSMKDFIMGRIEGLYDYQTDRKPALDMKEIQWQASAVIKFGKINPNPYMPLLPYLQREFGHLNDHNAVIELEESIKKFVSAKQVWVHHGRSTL